MVKIWISCLLLIVISSVNTVFASQVTAYLNESASVESVLGFPMTTVSSGIAIPLADCTLFVSTTGADLNTGATPETAFKTIKKGLETLKHGQNLCIKGGTYSEVLRINHQSIETEPISIGGYVGGGDVILTGNYKVPANKCTNLTKKTISKPVITSCHDTALVTLTGAKYINIHALTIKESSGSGLLIDSTSSNITLKSIKSINNNLSGLKIGESCTDVATCNKLGITSLNIYASVFNDNLVLNKALTSDIGAGIYSSDAVMTHLLLNDSMIMGNIGFGVYLNNSDFVTVTNNMISDNAKQNMYVSNNNTLLIDKNAFLCTDRGLSKFATAKNNKTLEYATGLQVGGALPIKTSLVDYGGYTITNNIFAGCSSNLVLNVQKSQLKNTNIVNNTLSNARTRLKKLAAARSLLLVGFNIENVIVSNNIIVQKDEKVRTVVGILPIPALKLENNIVHPAVSSSLVDKGFAIIDPKLKDPYATIDVNTFDATIFAPEMGSSAQGKGSDLKLPSLQADYRGALRSAVDIGAIQISAAPAQNTDSGEASSEETPTQAQDELPLDPEPTATTPIPVEDNPFPEPAIPDVIKDNNPLPDELTYIEPFLPDAGDATTPDPIADTSELPPVEDFGSTDEFVLDPVAYEPYDLTDPSYADDPASYETYELTDETYTLDPVPSTDETWALEEEIPLVDDTYDYSSTYALTDDTNLDPLQDTSGDLYPQQDFTLTDDIVKDDSAVFGTLPDTYAPKGGEILKNGNFELGKNTKGMPLNWFIKTGVGGSVSLALDGKTGVQDANKTLNLKVLKLPEKGYIELYQNGLNLSPTKKYKLSFTAKSDMGSDIDLYLANAVFPYDNLINTKYNVDLKPDWKEYTGIIGLSAQPAQSGKVRLVISFKASVGDSIMFDSISLYEVADDLVSVKSDNLMSSIDAMSLKQLAQAPAYILTN
ncbi:MAG: hypothetical protein RLY61_536 [Candidatus Parcubacteria bacterium]